MLLNLIKVYTWTCTSIKPYDLLSILHSSAPIRLLVKLETSWITVCLYLSDLCIFRWTDKPYFSFSLYQVFMQKFGNGCPVMIIYCEYKCVLRLCHFYNINPLINKMPYFYWMQIQICFCWLPWPSDDLWPALCLPCQTQPLSKGHMTCQITWMTPDIANISAYYFGSFTLDGKKKYLMS